MAMLSDILMTDTSQTEEEIYSAFVSGSAGVLDTKLTHISIEDETMEKAFRRIRKSMACDEKGFFCPSDIVGMIGKEAVSPFIFGNPGDLLVIFGKMPADKSVRRYIDKNSILGFYPLISATNGVMLDLETVLDNKQEIVFPLQMLLGSRFVFATKAKARKLIDIARAESINVATVGFVTGNGKIVIRSGQNVMCSIDKMYLHSNEQHMPAAFLGEKEKSYYREGQMAVLMYGLVYSAGFSTCVTVGYSGDISAFLAGLLGVYTASSAIKMRNLTLSLGKEKKGAGVTSGERRADEGDGIYIYECIAEDGDMPSPATYFDVAKTISKDVKGKSIKAVLPVYTSIDEEIKAYISRCGRVDYSYVIYPGTTERPSKISVLVISSNHLSGREIGAIIEPQSGVSTL